jgi:predicted nuclease of predicted toxin-antitoxin system
VKFLVDANLPPALARWLAAAGHEAYHVSDFGLEAMPDKAIWARARELNACTLPTYVLYGSALIITANGHPTVLVIITIVSEIFLFEGLHRRNSLP